MEDMIRLDQRLKACADLVSGTGIVCDVGSDHARLPVYLIQNKICFRAIAADIAEGPLCSAKATIQTTGLESQITPVLSDGLTNIHPEGISDVVIAGMGGETICSILSAPHTEWIRSVRLVLQPMTKVDLLRIFLAEHGFRITAERVVLDDTHCYVVLQVVWDGTVRKLSPAEALIGTPDLTSADARCYVRRQMERLHRIIGCLPSENPERQAMISVYDELCQIANREICMEDTCADENF